MKQIPPDDQLAQLTRYAARQGLILEVVEDAGYVRSSCGGRDGKGPIMHGVTALFGRGRDKAVALALDMLRGHVAELVAARRGTHRVAAQIGAPS